MCTRGNARETYIVRMSSTLTRTSHYMFRSSGREDASRGRAGGETRDAARSSVTERRRSKRAVSDLRFWSAGLGATDSRTRSSVHRDANTRAKRNRAGAGRGGDGGGGRERKGRTLFAGRRPRRRAARRNVPRSTRYRGHLRVHGLVKMRSRTGGRERKGPTLLAGRRPRRRGTGRNVPRSTRYRRHLRVHGLVKMRSGAGGNAKPTRPHRDSRSRRAVQSERT